MCGSYYHSIKYMKYKLFIGRKLLFSLIKMLRKDPTAAEWNPVKQDSSLFHYVPVLDIVEEAVYAGSCACNPLADCPLCADNIGGEHRNIFLYLFIHNGEQFFCFLWITCQLGFGQRVV